MRKIAILLICLGVQFINAQERVITTAVPFLLVAADARSAGLADQGVATSPDAYSQQYNPAKYAFSQDKQGFSMSYTPYLTDLVNDISLGQVTYFNRFDERMAFAAGLRYFGLGEIELRRDFDDLNPQIVEPNELAFDVSYALQLSEKFSMAVAGRYIRSNLRIADAGTDASAASSFAVDVAGYYQSEEIAYSDFNGRWRAGFNFQNLGPKITYDAAEAQELTGNFMPANMRVGAGFDFVLDEFNTVLVAVEFTKLLVPTPQVGFGQEGFTGEDLDGDGDVDIDDYNTSKDDYKRIGWVSGLFSSFGDAPDGFSEELKEFTYSVGAEYLYQDSFAFRLGYFNESEMKGARKFFALGAGFKYNVVRIDLSYLFSASKVKNPLENTLRFSLSFAFGDRYEQY
ncbi:MAG TPA: type IX secretion system outer membrane channel protein PorV [Flavobacterium sp.]|nr:type IX secretion system outer membrane channel protein PorV [Flavobacterium sp.]